MRPPAEPPNVDTQSQRATTQVDVAPAELRALQVRIACDNALLEMTREPVIVVDTQGRIRFWNSAAERTYGWKAEEVLGRSCQQILAAPMEVASKAAEDMDVPQRYETLHGRFSPRRKDGRALVVEFDARPYCGVDGQIVGCVSIHHGVAERRQFEGTVGETEARLLALVEATPLGIVMMDIDGNPIYYNPVCESLHDRSLSGASGLRWAECVHPDDRERIVRSWYAAATEQRMWSDTYRFLHQDGRVVWVSGRAAPMRIEGKTVGFVGTLEDVTALKTAEQTQRQLKEQEQKARAQAEHAIQVRDRMVGVVAHDLRNPLNTIALGISALLKDGLTAELRARQLEILERTVRSMDRLIRDLLDATTMDSGRFSIECGPTDIAELLRESMELFERAALQRDISLTCHPLPGLPVVAGDHQRLLQVLSNVIGNALKFTPPGGAVTISLLRSDEHLQFSVQDAGPGVSVKDLSVLFDRFWRAKGTSQEGAGLGLHISKGIVEAHGGRIWAECPTGSGLRVCWTIPCARPGTLPG